jgi:hypothetical protein
MPQAKLRCEACRLSQYWHLALAGVEGTGLGNLRRERDECTILMHRLMKSIANSETILLFSHYKFYDIYADIQYSPSTNFLTAS